MKITKEMMKKLPPLYNHEYEKDPMVWYKFLNTSDGMQYYVVEGEKGGDGNKKKYLFFGLVHWSRVALAFFTLSDAAIKRDPNFKPCRLSVVRKRIEKGT